IAYDENATSKEIAEAINKATADAGVGVTASVKNKVELSGFAADLQGASVTLTVNGKGVTVNNFNANDLTALKNQLNSAGADVAADFALKDDGTLDKSKLVLTASDDVTFDIAAEDATATPITGNLVKMAVNDGNAVDIADDDNDVVAVGQVVLSGVSEFGIVNAGLDV